MRSIGPRHITERRDQAARLHTGDRRRRAAPGIAVDVRVSTTSASPAAAVRRAAPGIAVDVRTPTERTWWGWCHRRAAPGIAVDVRRKSWIDHQFHAHNRTEGV